MTLIYGFLGSFLPVTFVTVGLRLYSRWRFNHIGKDDVLVVVGLVSLEPILRGRSLARVLTAELNRCYISGSALRPALVSRPSRLSNHHHPLTAGSYAIWTRPPHLDHLA